MAANVVVPAVPVVMLVEPDPAARQDAVTRLEEAGFRVIACAQRDQALAHFDDTVDVVITRQGAGDDFDGAALTRELKDRVDPFAFVPVLVMGPADGRMRAFEAGCDEYLEGEVSFFEVDARIRSLLVHRWHYLALARANQQLVDAQNKKRELAGLVVHDLRNPLSALQGNLDLLAEELAATTPVIGIVSDSQELCQRALGMVASILDVEELEAGLLQAHPSAVHVAELLQRVSRRYRVPVGVRRLQLSVDVDDDLQATFDVDLVSRLVENLLDNSVRYAPVGGMVVLSAARDGDQLVVRVGNDGPPIAADDRERIFERFYRIEARRAGQRANRGLGLYFCSLVAEAHGGTIGVESLPELPTCFTLRLPQESGTAAEV